MMQTFLAPWLASWHLGSWPYLIAGLAAGSAAVLWGEKALDWADRQLG